MMVSQVRVAIGFKAHSGWAALVVVGERDGRHVVLDRRRIELVEEAWAKQPYHAAEHLVPGPARSLVIRGIEAARRIALEQVRAAIQRERERGNEVVACAVLVGNPMPAWSIEEILAVHFRMHKAEGVLFREALASAAAACGLRVEAIEEKLLGAKAGTLKVEVPSGPPWGKDQKDAAVAAGVALRG